MSCNNIQDYALPFATWELRLYLNSHPTDRRALTAYRQLCAQSECVENYACLPEEHYSSSRWLWINDPWPWEPEANTAAREV